MDRIEKLKAFERESPDDPFLKHALGMEYRSKGDDEAALACFEAALKSDPDYVPSFYQLAKYWEQKANREKALEHYDRGIEAAQKTGDAHMLNELRQAREQLLDE
jgi:Tfp pilus assembly protein PilF